MFSEESEGNSPQYGAITQPFIGKCMVHHLKRKDQPPLWRTPFPINLDQAQTWIEKSIFIGNISLIYRISDGSERILNTDYQIGGISEKYWENHRNISNILVWNR